jgi:tripartite-type tricarboxylate transporter receptor subunit TctC
MRRLYLGISAIVLATSLVLSTACSPAAPAPSPTKPAEPAAAAAPTKPVQAAQPAAPTAEVKAAAPTEAPKKVDFPVKSKPITIVCPLPAGGSMDIAARVVAALLEKDLGTSVQVVNKVGAGGQVGMTELAGSKPDGYTIGAMALPSTTLMYLDPDRKAAFTGTDFVPLGLDNSEPVVVAVKVDSPFKTIKDVVEAAKAKPNQVKSAVSGILVVPHLGALDFMKATETKIGLVHFDGGPPSVAAMLGGHTDMDFEFTGSLWPSIKSGQSRILAVQDKAPYKPLPDVPTAESQGIKSYMTVARGYAAPKGTPKEIADILSAAIKKAVTTPEYAKKLEELGMLAQYVDPAKMAEFWASQETQVKPLLQMAKEQAAKN